MMKPTKQQRAMLKSLRAGKGREQNGLFLVEGVRLCEELDTVPGRTTKDMRFTVESARCLGCCSLAPAVMVNDKVYGRVKIGELSKILKDYE